MAGRVHSPLVAQQTCGVMGSAGRRAKEALHEEQAAIPGTRLWQDAPSQRWRTEYHRLDRSAAGWLTELPICGAGAEVEQQYKRKLADLADAGRGVGEGWKEFS